MRVCVTLRVTISFQVSVRSIPFIRTSFEILLRLIQPLPDLDEFEQKGVRKDLKKLKMKNRNRNLMKLKPAFCTHIEVKLKKKQRKENKH